ncbi:DUF763 domain-containing protein [Aeropyrum pernix]|nr:DUF763 domain-containing protein [Aeropyrum pernix]
MTGVADLPLHSGKVPPWMLRVMERLARSIARAIVEIHGPDAVVRGLADPYWFQAFNNAIGMDWDSSGSTTVLLAVLRKVSLSEDLGFIVVGGKGRRMRGIDREVEALADRVGVDASKLLRFSQAAGRVSNVLLQDGYSPYIHAVVASETGLMVAVQQGMNVEAGLSRRYHVDRESVEEPFRGVSGIFSHAGVLNAVASESKEARKLYVDLAREGARRIERMVLEASRMVSGAPTLLDYMDRHPGASYRNPSGDPRSHKPYYKPVPLDSRTRKYLEMLAENPPVDEQDLLTAPGLTPKVVRALALVADVIYGVPTSHRDPVSTPLNPFVYAYSVGGKDGVPYRFDRRTAERVVLALEEAVELARLGRDEKLKALRRLRRLLDPLRS